MSNDFFRDKKLKGIKKSSHKGLDFREQKNGRGCFNCSENISQAQNGCKLMNYAHRFDNSRKYLCFQRFLKQRNFSAQAKGLFLRNKRKMPQITVKPATVV